MDRILCLSPGPFRPLVANVSTTLGHVGLRSEFLRSMWHNEDSALVNTLSNTWAMSVCGGGKCSSTSIESLRSSHHWPTSPAIGVLLRRCITEGTNRAASGVFPIVCHACSKGCCRFEGKDKHEKKLSARKSSERSESPIMSTYSSRNPTETPTLHRLPPKAGSMTIVSHQKWCADRHSQQCDRTKTKEQFLESLSEAGRCGHKLVSPH